MNLIEHCRRSSITGLSILHCNRGVAATEFAITISILLTMFLGGYEYSRFILVHQKAETVAYTVADTVAQSTSVTNAQLQQLLTAAAQILQPFPFDGVVIVSSVSQAGTTSSPKVRWQYKGGGPLDRTSQIGPVSGNASLPGDLTLKDKENVITAEVYYAFEPVFSTALLGPVEIYKSAIFKPRLGALTTAPN